MTRLAHLHHAVMAAAAASVGQPACVAVPGDISLADCSAHHHIHISLSSLSPADLGQRLPGLACDTTPRLADPWRYKMYFSGRGLVPLSPLAGVQRCTFPIEPEYLVAGTCPGIQLFPAIDLK